MPDEKHRSRFSQIILISLILVVVCSGISWLMVTNVAAAKSDYSRSFKQINNDMQHIKDMATGLNNFTTRQNTRADELADSVQVQFEQTDARLSDMNNQTDKLQSDLGDLKSHNEAVQRDLSATRADVSNIKTDVAGVKTRTDSLESTLNTLKTATDTLTQQEATTQSTLTTLSGQVSDLNGGFTLNPTLTSGSTGGSINISMKSSISQIVALKVIFRATAETERTAAIDTTYAALKTTPPVTLTANVALRPLYDLYLNANSKYCIDSICFITKGVSLTAGTESDKTLTFTASSDYEVSIVPLFEASLLTTSGGSASTW